MLGSVVWVASQPSVLTDLGDTLQVCVRWPQYNKREDDLVVLYILQVGSDKVLLEDCTEVSVRALLSSTAFSQFCPPAQWRVFFPSLQANPHLCAECLFPSVQIINPSLVRPLHLLHRSLILLFWFFSLCHFLFSFSDCKCLAIILIKSSKLFYPHKIILPKSLFTFRSMEDDKWIWKALSNLGLVWLQAPTPGPWAGSYMEGDFKFSLRENFLTE